MSEPTLNRNPFTITRWILKEQKKHANAKGDLTIILNSITLAIKIISGAAKGAGIFQKYGINMKKDDIIRRAREEKDEKDDGISPAASTSNLKGGIREFAHETFINSVKWCGKVSCMLSTARKDPIFFTDVNEAKYVVVFDPIDGKQNIEINASIGTIFGIYRVSDPKKAKKNDYSDLLQKSDALVCAGYALYGDATLLILSFGADVNGFTLDPQIGEFILTHRNLKIPEQAPVYSINEGYEDEWEKPIQIFVRQCKKPEKADAKPLKSRYIGCMVADVHRSIIKGGIYLYPRNKLHPQGKLSLLCECGPLAFVIESAGGRASDGTQKIGGIQPKDIHQTTPIFLGSKRDVMTIEVLYKRNK